MSVLVCDCVTAPWQPLITCTHIRQLILPCPSRDAVLQNSLSLLGRSKSRKLRAANPWFEKAPGSLQVSVYTGAGQTFFFEVVLTLQPFGSAWHWARSGLKLEHQIIHRFWGDPQAGAALQWVPAAGALGNEAFPELWAAQGSWEVGLLLHHSYLPGYLKTSLGRFLGVWRHNQSPGSFYFTTIWDLQSSLSW